MQTKLVLLLVSILLLALPAIAQSGDRDMKKESVIWVQLKGIAPGQLENFKAATVALDNGDYRESARLYEEVYKKAPAFDPVMRRLGGSLIQIGRVQEGAKLLEMAVKQNPSPENLVTLANFLAYPGENRDGTAAEKQRALVLAQQAFAANKDPDPAYPFLIAQISLELEREADFRAVMKTIDQQYPDLMATHYFRALRAAMDEDWALAEDEIKIAQSLGLPAETVKSFRDSGVQTHATVWRYTYYALYMVGAWIVGLVMLFALGKLMSNLTLRWIDTSDPNASAGGQQVTLRRFYRRLIDVAGLYYYISIPVVIFLVIAVAGSIIYGFLMAGQIPIKIAALLVIGALVTVFTMVRSLFIRIESEDPGRSLTEQEAPGLWALAREVASSVQTRPVDEIRVTPGTEMAVYENGTFREKAGDRAKRVLLVGVGVLNDFKQGAFRAVLAHEYGHFSHRDTAGGDVAIRVNNDMMKFAHGMAEQNQAVWWNIAFLFLVAYHFIFRRISSGATRLQEILADRVAVRNYGATAFEEGLRHVVRRQIEFNDVAEWEINAAKGRRPLQNLYEIAVTNKDIVDEQVAEAINRATSEDDTHPSPIERFRYAMRITSTNQQTADGQVWDLFADRAQLTGEMSALIERLVKATSG